MVFVDHRILSVTDGGNLGALIINTACFLIISDAIRGFLNMNVIIIEKIMRRRRKGTRSVYNGRSN